MKISVRVASDADIALLVRLNGGVQRLHAELEPGFFRSETDVEEVSAFFGARLALPENHFRIADGEDGPTGYVWFEVQRRAATPLTLARTRIYIHHVSVVADARNRGVGSALLGQVEAEAMVAGITNIALDAWWANEAARRFFEGRGFAPFNVSFGKRLDR